MKNNGFSKNRSGVSTGKSNSTEQQDQFVSNLRHAICNDELRLHYQPRYNMISGKADILEALVRWRRPGVGLFYPEVFIAAAEQNGLIFSLDFWVFERCCIDLKQFQENVNPNIKMAVNISVLSCESIYYAQKIIEISEKYDVLLSDFEFEITGSTHTHDIRKVNAFCETLTNYGVKFGLDDFGAGQSSLSHLSMLPVSAINIDQSFIQGIGQSKRCETIICSLISMAKALDIKVVAVGVENNKQYWFMREAGCDHQQGFLLGRSAKREDIKLQSLSQSSIDSW